MPRTRNRISTQPTKIDVRISVSFTLFLAFCFFSLLAPSALYAQTPDYSTTYTEFQKGNYRLCLRECISAISKGEDSERWYVLKLQCELETGNYAEAAKTYKESVKDYPNENSIHLRILGREAFLRNNDPKNAQRMYDEILYMKSGRVVNVVFGVLTEMA